MKQYLKINVFEAAQERLKFIFDNFDNVLVAFSGGKDSGVLLNLAYDYAVKNNFTHKLAMYYQDYEAGYPQTDEYVKREFDRMNIKPDNFTWKQYAEFLLDTLPTETKKKFLNRLNTKLNNWTSRGNGRNPEVIKYMESLGLNLEKTGKIAKNCHKKKIYEIVKIKDRIVDDSTDLDFRHIPNWKDVCISLLKNDFDGIYLSFGRSKQQMEKRKIALELYKNF